MRPRIERPGDGTEASGKALHHITFPPMVTVARCPRCWRAISPPLGGGIVRCCDYYSFEWRHRAK